MTLTALEQTLIADLDFEPGCEWCQQHPAVLNLIFTCGCDHLYCSPCRQQLRQRLDIGWAEATCQRCGWVLPMPTWKTLVKAEAPL